MRGLPPIQALLLLIILCCLGAVGSHYIGLGVADTPTEKPLGPVTSDEVIEAEVELVFSSPPESYSLSQPPASTGEPDKVMLESSNLTENPCYGDVNIMAHRVSTYWLHVRWQNEAAENTQHFVRINISPSYGKSRSFTYFSGSKEIDETFDYSTGGSRNE